MASVNALYKHPVPTLKIPHPSLNPPTTKTQQTQKETSLETSPLAISAKNTNHTIGALQIALTNLDKMQPQAQSLLDLSNQIQNHANTQEALQANTLKSRIQKIYDQSLYQGVNVFERSYADTSLNLKSIKPSALTINDPSTSKAFLKALEEQKMAITEALKKQVRPSTTDKDFSTLQPDKLKGLKNAHNTDAIKAQKVQALLHA